MGCEYHPEDITSEAPLIFRTLPGVQELPLKEQHLPTWLPKCACMLNEARRKASSLLNQIEENVITNQNEAGLETFQTL